MRLFVPTVCARISSVMCVGATIGLLAPSPSRAETSPTGFDEHVRAGACELGLKLSHGDEWGGVLIIDGILASRIDFDAKHQKLKLVTPVMPQQSLQINVKNQDTGLRWLVPLTIHEDVSVWLPTAATCRRPQADLGPMWNMSTDVGMVIATFSGDIQTSNGASFETPTEPVVRPLAAPSLSVRPVSWSRWGGGGVTANLHFAYSAKPSVSCNRVDRPHYCDTAQPGAGDIPDIIKGATSAEVYFGPRVDLLTLGAGSDTPTTVYGSFVWGTIWILGVDDGKARNHHRLVGGFRVASGKKKDSFLEAGVADNELVTLDNKDHWNRYYVAGGMYVAPDGLSKIVATILRKEPLSRIFFKAEFDRASGPDFLQTSFGLSLDFNELVTPFNRAR